MILFGYIANVRLGLLPSGALPVSTPRADNVDEVPATAAVCLPGVLLHSLLATLHPDEGFEPIEGVLASGDPLVSLPEFAALVQQLLKPHKALI